MFFVLVDVNEIKNYCVIDVLYNYFALKLCM